VERSWGVLGEGGRDPIITVGTMAPGFFFRWTTIISLVVPFGYVSTFPHREDLREVSTITPGTRPTVLMCVIPIVLDTIVRSLDFRISYTETRGAFLVSSGGGVQSQPEDGPHIWRKHVVVIILL